MYNYYFNHFYLPVMVIITTDSKKDAERILKLYYDYKNYSYQKRIKN